MSWFIIASLDLCQKEQLEDVPTLNKYGTCVHLGFYYPRYLDVSMYSIYSDTYL